MKPSDQIKQMRAQNWSLVRTLMSLHTTSLDVISLLIANASLKMTSSVHFAGELVRITVRQSDAWSLNCESSFFFGGYSQVQCRKCRRRALKSSRWQLCGSQAAVDQYFKAFMEMNQAIWYFPWQWNSLQTSPQPNLPDTRPHIVPCVIHKLCMRPSGALSVCRAGSSPT